MQSQLPSVVAPGSQRYRVHSVSVRQPPPVEIEAAISAQGSLRCERLALWPRSCAISRAMSSMPASSAATIVSPGVSAQPIKLGFSAPHQEIELTIALRPSSA